jgi:hypothetical protein
MTLSAKCLLAGHLQWQDYYYTLHFLNIFQKYKSTAQVQNGHTKRPQFSAYYSGTKNFSKQCTELFVVWTATVKISKSVQSAKHRDSRMVHHNKSMFQEMLQEMPVHCSCNGRAVGHMIKGNGEQLQLFQLWGHADLQHVKVGRNPMWCPSH